MKYEISIEGMGATMWLMKVDEKKINEAIEDLRDEE